MQPITLEILEALDLGFTMKEAAFLLDVEYSKVYRVHYNYKRKRDRKVYKRKTRKKTKRKKKTKPQKRRGYLFYDVYLRQKMLAEKMMGARGEYGGAKITSLKRHPSPSRLMERSEIALIPDVTVLLDDEFEWLDFKYVGDPPIVLEDTKKGRSSYEWALYRWRSSYLENPRRKKEKTYEQIEETIDHLDEGRRRAPWGWETPEGEEEEEVEGE